MDKVKAILAAAETMLLQHGYESTLSDPDRLIRAAQVSTGSFYTYFANCEAVMEALRLQYLTQAADVVERVLSEHHADWKDAIRSLTEGYVTFYRQPTIGQLLLNSPRSRLTQVKEHEVDNYVAVRLKDLLRTYNEAFADVDQEKFDIAEEIGGRLLLYAFRKDPLGSESVIAEANIAMISYLSRYASKTGSRVRIAKRAATRRKID